MPRVAANGIEIEYETFGSPDDPALLLVNGFTSQLTNWEADMCEMFASRGRFVIRYDNRDVGLSTHLDGQPAPIGEITRALTSHQPLPPVAYTLSDFAADGMGLLSALGIEQAHIAGVSMGGMIVQAMAIEHPSRVLTLTSIMSRTGEHQFGKSTPEANAALLAPPPRERSAYIEQSVIGRKIWGSQRYFDADYERIRLARDYDRMFYPEGAGRQMAAIMASPPRTEGLRNLRVPTLVIHGRVDQLITLSGGERTAELVPGANLLVMNDMGHDLPRPLWPVLVDAMISHQTHAIA
jgi:pimeloyl-ACP methyl ester carboxylesterase